MNLSDARAPGRSAEVADAIRVLRHSSRELARQARTRYMTDMIKWPFRDAFDSIWQTVQCVPGWLHEGDAAVMYALMRERPPRTVVEIGSYLGRSTVFFGLVIKQMNIDSRVVAIDPHTGDRQQLAGLATERLATFDLFRQHCDAAGVQSIVAPRLESSLEVANDWSQPVDLLYVDGWHSYEAVIADGAAWLPFLSPHGVVVFDDYAAYEEVRSAVTELAERGGFHLWGSVFGQAIGGLTPEPPRALQRLLLFSPAGVRRAVSKRGRRNISGR